MNIKINEEIDLSKIKLPKRKVPITINFDSTKTIGFASVKALENGDVIAICDLGEKGKEILSRPAKVSYSYRTLDKISILSEIGIVK